MGAQDLVKNIIGGLVILVDRPYHLGDRVKIGDAYGEIDHIGLRSAKLTTPDDTRVTIPNSDILRGKAWNANSGVPVQSDITRRAKAEFMRRGLLQGWQSQPGYALVEGGAVA